MKEKCNKYEQLINFGTEEELMKHISQCEDCRQEHEKMLAVSSLIQEAKPYFLKKKQDRHLIVRFRGIAGGFRFPGKHCSHR